MRNQKRNLNEWLDIITECRQSGLSDATCCEQNRICTLIIKKVKDKSTCFQLAHSTGMRL